MSHRQTFTQLALLTVVGVALVLAPELEWKTAPQVAEVEPAAQVSAGASAIGDLASTTLPLATSTKENSSRKESKATTTLEKPLSKAVNQETGTASTEVTRIKNPYTTQPFAWPEVNTKAREALVNILCMPKSGALRPITGSGILIDPRGIILTNAHVAQYVLLSESANIDLTCTIRTGSPAKERWIPQVLYIPPVWVQEHAKEITTSHPLGTGEHDYALLYVIAAVDGSTLPERFPYLPVDTREAIGFTGDQMVIASYPAEFLGGLAAQRELYSVSSITAIQQLLTFNVRSVDAVSLGGVIVAQGGSSGGAVVNAWGKLIGLITTTSEGTTTSDRDLRAITLSYIDRDLMAQTNYDLEMVLAGDPKAQTIDFTDRMAPKLLKLLIQAISR